MASKNVIQEIEKEEHFRLIVENSADLITTLDRQGMITYISPACKKILGYNSEELLGLNVATYAHPDDKKRMLAVFNKALKSQIQSEIFRIRHKNGKWVYLEVSEAIALINEHEPLRLVTIARDVTSRIENARSKEKFISFLSHELKTPLTTIFMLMSFLEKRILGEQQEFSSYYSKLELEISHFSQLIQVMTDVSDMEQGLLQLHKERFFLNELIQTTLQSEMESGKHEIILRSEGEEEVSADKQRLAEVITILFANAVKYSAADTPIMIGVYQKDGHTEVAITDYGLGIPKVEQKKIFEKFYQSGNQKQYSRPGLGIGLYLARELIKMHEGKLWVISEYGKRSTFYFTLPLSH